MNKTMVAGPLDSLQSLEIRYDPQDRSRYHQHILCRCAWCYIDKLDRHLLADMQLDSLTRAAARVIIGTDREALTGGRSQKDVLERHKRETVSNFNREWMTKMYPKKNYAKLKLPESGKMAFEVYVDVHAPLRNEHVICVRWLDFSKTSAGYPVATKYFKLSGEPMTTK